MNINTQPSIKAIIISNAIMKLEHIKRDNHYFPKYGVITGNYLVMLSNKKIN